jgi:phytoene desaturase
MSRRVIVVGAGPGGLTAAMILAAHGYQVQVVEKQPRVGGRNAAVQVGEYTFDLGPTFLMMKHVLVEVFQLAGRRLEDYLTLREVDPLYRLVFGDGRVFHPSRIDREATVRQIEELFPGNAAGYWRYLRREKVKHDHLVPCLQVPYDSLRHLFRMRLIKAVPWLDVHQSLFDELGRYFKDDDLRLAFTFQAKYLGMSPWACPGLFSIISFLEHNGGIWHPQGGLNRISRAMAEVVREHGGTIEQGTPVERLLVERGRVVGVALEGGEERRADYVVLNADFAQAMGKLVEPRWLRRWHPDRLARKKYSCSTFMLYLGVNRIYHDIEHHNIIFSADYKRNIHEIAVTGTLSADPSIYIQNASPLDPSLAPPGKSTLYILVPVPNLTGRIDWNREAPAFREQVLTLAETRGGFTGLRDHIEAERMIVPTQWRDELEVYRGATFNLAHNVGQMLWWRPHNRFEEIDDLYLVGGGTHPGSGLPTIFESGRISSELILQRDGRRLGA